ncbi:chemotaxis protein CheB [Photobacterium chitinilyticum]|uniref:protein-glutamate methylesterase n=1 Tax=Photobacterium chitinilyticum TaxID=2485123 RepID=A0A444JX20_9GAMM|nr:chemotaxis protein CheB [Photobacterium chitinilyticum]RWX57585.1 chemotaxis protein CheB [Photobacterium chitinilyticum]
MGINRQYRAVVIGVSAGGLSALDKILPVLKGSFSLPVLVVQHVSPTSENYLPIHFSHRCLLEVKEAEDKELIEGGVIYFAPPNYHLLVELNRSIALSTEERVNFSRPSIDVLFETAADAYLNELVGVVLTGANSDGAAGMAKIKQFGGLAVVQSPETAEAEAMPRAAIDAVDVDYILPLKEIGCFLNTLCKIE